MREMIKVLKDAFIKNPKETIKETLFLVSGGILVWVAMWLFYILTLNFIK